LQQQPDDRALLLRVTWVEPPKYPADLISVLPGNQPDHTRTPFCRFEVAQIGRRKSGARLSNKEKAANGGPKDDYCYFGGLSAGPDLLPGSPGTLL
jgi:hypothetical protein